MCGGGTNESTAAKKRGGFFRHKWVWIPIASIVLATVAILLIFNLSPRPGAAMIKYVFTNGAETTKEKMEPFAPAGITVISDRQYRPGDGDAFLDVYFPDGTAQPLPTLIWTHGGAWISGNKEDASPYYKIIAAEGYTVISLDYSLGPGKKYPTAIHQVNDALAYIQANAAELHVDPNRIMMAGDSAGAQITSQYAAIVTNPEFAAEMEITPSLKPEQLRGVLLFCGIYDLQTFMSEGGVVEGIVAGILHWGSRTSIWAYTGTKDSNSTALLQMSTIDHVTATFPPTFITGGNGDPLTDNQSIPLASTLQNLGVETVTLFFEEDHEPSLGHEYQFELDKADAQTALQQLFDFMKTRLSAP